MGSTKKVNYSEANMGNHYLGLKVLLSENILFRSIFLQGREVRSGRDGNLGEFVCRVESGI